MRQRASLWVRQNESSIHHVVSSYHATQNGIIRVILTTIDDADIDVDACVIRFVVCFR